MSEIINGASSCIRSSLHSLDAQTHKIKLWWTLEICVSLLQVSWVLITSGGYGREEVMQRPSSIQFLLELTRCVFKVAPGCWETGGIKKHTFDLCLQKQPWAIKTRSVLRLTIHAECPMHLEDFPMDSHACPLKFGSCKLNLTLQRN